MAIPALRELRRVFADAKITLHTRSWSDGLFQDASFIDEIVTFAKDRWKAREVYDNSQFLRDDNYDVAVLLPNSFESALTTFLIRIPRRVGYNKDFRGLLLTDPIPVPEWKSRKHEVFYYLNLVAEVEKRVLGRETVSQVCPDVSLEVSHERRDRASTMLSENGINPTRKTIALGVGSTNSRAKRWPADRYAALSDKLQNELGANVILVGADDEREVASHVESIAIKKPISLAGKTDLSQVVGVLSIVDLLVSNDMGLAHVAAAVGTPTLVIFGPTNPETTRPFAENSDIIREQVECSPCMLRDCPIDHRCMTRISVDRVFNAAVARLMPEPELV